MHCSVLHCIAGCCSVLHCVAVCCSVLQSVAVCCSVLQSVAVCCSLLQSVAVSVVLPPVIPPDPINYLCSLTGVCISQKHFTYRSVQIFQMLFQGFYAQDLILRTRLCGTDLINQSGWHFHFHRTKMVRRKYFVQNRYELPKGTSAGLALQYFYMIHRVGRTKPQ